MTQKEYNVGDKVWWAKYEQGNVRVTCPICFGKMRVTVILGDDSQIETDCTFCEAGFQTCGYILERAYISDVEQVEITHKEVHEGVDGRNVVYGYGDYRLTLDNAFNTREEAEEKLKEKIAKVQQEDLERLEYNKQQIPRKFSWHVGYYQRMKKDALKTIERCDKKISYFKEKVKEEKIK